MDHEDDEGSIDCTCPTCLRVNAVSGAGVMLFRANTPPGPRMVARELLTLVAENDLLRGDIERLINCLESRDAELAEFRATFAYDGLEDEDEDEEVGAN